jgi:hypothetical protein
VAVGIAPGPSGEIGGALSTIPAVLNRAGAAIPVLRALPKGGLK